MLPGELVVYSSVNVICLLFLKVVVSFHDQSVRSFKLRNGLDASGGLSRLSTWYIDNMASASSIIDTISPSSPSGSQSPIFFHYKNGSSPSDLVSLAGFRDTDSVMIFIEGRSGSLLSTHSKFLKADLTKQVADHAAIDSVKFTVNTGFFTLAYSVDRAVHVLQLTTITNVPVVSHVQHESIITRFSLYGIHVGVSCEEIAEELTSNGIQAFEVWRFLMIY